MPDVYITITEATPALLEGLMTALERRAADPQQRAMLEPIWPMPPSPRAPACWKSAVAREQ